MDFQPKVIKKDKEGQFILILGKILQEEQSILNIYAPNAKAATFIKESLVKVKAHIAAHTISFHESSPSKDNKGKTPTQRWKLHPRKIKKVILQQT